MTYHENRGRGHAIMAKKRPNLEGDADDFKFLRESVGFGTIQELTSKDLTLVAPFADKSPNFVYSAGSGLPPGSYPEFYGPDERPLAVEIVRYEPNPKPTEGPLNTNRYVLGLSDDGMMYQGYDVTVFDANPTNGQVGNHWTDWDEVDARFPTKPKPQPPGGKP